MLQLTTATRQKVKILMSIASPTGFGKTYSALLLAYGMTGDWEKIAVIDTENGSASLYADLGLYKTIKLEPPYTPDSYIEAIKICEAAGMEVIIIDSATHVWTGQGGLLEYKDSLGGKFQDWAKVTPIYQTWLNAILHCKAHTIVTLRKKQAYNMTIVNGVTKVEKAGLDDQIRDGFDYEQTIAFELINENHIVHTSKDRTRLFMNKPEFVITAETGQQILEWCEIGEDIPGQVKVAIAKLSNCADRDQILMLKETLPLLVVNHADFKAAGNARWAALAPAAANNQVPNSTDAPAEGQTTEPAQDQVSEPAGSDGAAPAPESQPADDGAGKVQNNIAGIAALTADELKQQIQDADHPDQLTKLLAIVNDLEADARKSLRITVTTKAKKMGWVANPDTKRFEAPAADTPVGDAAPEPDENPEGETTEAKFPGDNAAEGSAHKALYDLLDTAASIDELHALYTANEETIKGSGPLTYIFQFRLEELENAHILEKINAASGRAELLEIYKSHQKEIQASESLTQQYDQARSKFPREILENEPQKRALEWFQARIGKTVMAHGFDDDGKPFATPYKVEDETYPAAMYGWQESGGFTFCDMMQIPEGQKVD